MKNGKCPKCGSSNVYTDTEKFTEIQVNYRRVTHDDYICTDCGYHESYINDKGVLNKVAESWKKVG
jgi:predicted nucleic-acid-binding Zn-ribbon protein